MPPIRDSQRQKVYDAEMAVGPFENELGTLAACQEYVDKVVGSAWVQSRWGRMNVRVGRGRGYRGTSYGDGYITLGIPGQNARVILHELAHELHARGRSQQRSGPRAAHGREFCAIYVALVTRFLGAETGRKLRASYREHGVRFRSPGVVPTAGQYAVVTQTQRKAAAKAKTTKPLTPLEQAEAARLLRRAVASGMFGEPGRKPRVHAQTIARTLEKAGS